MNPPMCQTTLSFQLFCDLSTKMRCKRNFDSVSSCLEVKKKLRDFQSDRQLFYVNMIYPGQNVSRCAQAVQEPCMTHCMLHRENFVAKDMSDEFSNVRSLTRYEIFHSYIIFSSYSILCPSLIEYRVMANCKVENISIINRINLNELCVTDDLQLCSNKCRGVFMCVCVCEI